MKIKVYTVGLRHLMVFVLIFFVDYRVPHYTSNTTYKI